MKPEVIQARVERLRPWFHYIDLGSGIVTKRESAIGEPLEHPRPTWKKVQDCLPKDLSGKTVLDVGCNAGFYAIEVKRRGASRVVGVDSQRNLVRQAVFVREVLGLDIDYRRLTVYDLDPRQMGQFDVVLALGLVYHCKHLVLALEKLFLVTRELLILETAIYPPEALPVSSEYSVGGVRSLLHPLAYVANPPDAKEAIYNWFLPGKEALRALLVNVGFDEIEERPATQTDRVILACRKHQPYPDSRAISYLSANLSFISGPAECQVGEVISFNIHVENNGYSWWLQKGEAETDRGAVHLVAHVFGEDELPLSWYHAGAFLPRDVLAGETVDIEIVMRAPEAPGRYELEFDMISEHISWFDDLGSSTLRHQLWVKGNL